jgi:pyruvate-ferredoxin/flavodoxin oxidoreductase
VANATGCSSIYGGNLPTTPYTTNRDGRGPAWANSLFEDNAEYGYGLRLSIDQHTARARALVTALAPQLPTGLADAILAADQSSEAGIQAQRDRVAALRHALEGVPPFGAVEAGMKSGDHREPGIFDYLVKKSVWIVGGDGWAYDIGYGGLDHVLASGANVKILVLDTEVYSNTGGQQSKATPTGAAAKFAITGKSGAKKDLGLMAMSYGHVYVAQVAFGARDAQTLKAFQDAEAYDGPALIIAYSHCIAHGYDMADGLAHQRLAAETGYWPLYHFDPKRARDGQPGLVLDSPAPRADVSTLMALESRFQLTDQHDHECYQALVDRARHQIAKRVTLYQELATPHVDGAVPPPLSVRGGSDDHPHEGSRRH